MKFTILEIIKGNIIVLLSYIVSFLIEKTTQLHLLWWNLIHKQNEMNARGTAMLASIYYFIVNIIVLFYDLRKYPNDPDGYSFLLWFLMIIICIYGFYSLHNRVSLRGLHRDKMEAK